MRNILTLLLLCFMSASASVDNLSGTYTNQLNSTVVLNYKGGVLTGTYQSAVGDASGNYPLYGSATGSDGTATFGFCVAWNNEKNGNTGSQTCWTGRMENGELDTFWVLATQPNSKGQTWSSNLFGKDRFSK